MKTTILWVRMGLVLAVTTLLMSCSRREASEADAKRGDHGEGGEHRIVMDENLQARSGLQIEAAQAVSVSSELKAYGRVLDPAPLAALANDLATSRAAAAASQHEFDRLKSLSAQNNASARALETAEAAALRDQLQVNSARDKLISSWGKTLADRSDLAGLAQSLISLEYAIVRVDVPPGEKLSAVPAHARLTTLSDQVAQSDFVGEAGSVDPQTQSRGLLFLVTNNDVRLVPGAAVTGYLETPGDAVNGVSIPRPAVIRFAGATWVYVQREGTNFVRSAVTLERPLTNGWFVSRGIDAGDQVVVSGAQTILSEELNRSGFLSGERD
jgi:hypothetical protein